MSTRRFGPYTVELSNEDKVLFPDAGLDKGDLVDYYEAGASPHVMTTGSRGLHVVTPLQRDSGFDAVRDVAHGLAKRLAERHPDTLTTEQRRHKRGDRIYLDVMRNSYGQTTVCPYSVRARAGAPVAMPLTREELDDPDLRPDGWSMASAPERLTQRGDAWQGMHRHAVSLSSLRRDLPP